MTDHAINQWDNITLAGPSESDWTKEQLREEYGSLVASWALQIGWIIANNDWIPDSICELEDAVENLDAIIGGWGSFQAASTKDDIVKFIITARVHARIMSEHIPESKHYNVEEICEHLERFVAACDALLIDMKNENQ